MINDGWPDDPLFYRALKTFLDPSSLVEIHTLLDEFHARSSACTSAVVEFSTYSVPVGILPHRNTVVWEVRDY